MTIQPPDDFLRKDRIILVLIMGAFILPLIGAWMLAGQWRPEGRAHHGELLVPARPISHFQVLAEEGGELNKAYLQGRWTLVYMDGRSGCDESCRQGLYKIRQIRLALGKEMPRVQRLLLLTEMPEAMLSSWLQQEHAGMTVGVADTTTRGFLARSFSGTAVAGGWIYLIDPLTNLVMRYPAQVNPGDILKDLKRLLKLSKIG